MIIKAILNLDSIRRYSSKEEEKKEAVALMHARLERMKNVPETEILKAKFMQLKVLLLLCPEIIHYFAQVL
jgi:hypothetical protein